MVVALIDEMARGFAACLLLSPIDQSDRSDRRCWD